MTQIVNIEAIHGNPFQSRSVIDEAELDLLMDSVKSGFWDTTFRVRPNGQGFQLVWGHRRLQALRRLGKKEVTVEIVKLSDQAMAEESLAENCQRSNLPDIDKAEAILKLLKMLMAKEYKGREIPALEHIAKALGYRRRSIEELLHMAHMSAETRAILRTQRMGWGAANIARRLGGDRMVRHAAAAAIGLKELERMTTAVNELPTSYRSKVVEKIIVDRHRTSEGVRELVRREASRLKGRGAPEKPELDSWLFEWSIQFDGLQEKLKQVLVYKNLVREQFPARLASFRTSWEKLRATVDSLVK